MWRSPLVSVVYLDHVNKLSCLRMVQSNNVANDVVQRTLPTNAPNERIRTNKFERVNERIVTAANRKVKRMSQRVSWKYYSTSEGMIKRTEQQCYTHKPRKLRTNNHQPNNPTNARTMNDQIIDLTNNHTVEPTGQQCVHYC